jgi:hypothetical protein
MWGVKQPGNRMKIRERRAKTRLHSSLLNFMNRNGSNAGLVFNITETGMALTSAQPLFEDRFIDLRVQSSDSFEWIDLTGQIVWKSKSKKEIGIEFVGLNNEALQRIRSWIASETSSREFHSEADASFIGPAETLPRMKSWIFSEASRGETSWQETGPPGSVRNDPQNVRNWLFSEAFHGGPPRQEIASPPDSLCTESQDVRNWLFPETLFSKPPLDSKRPIEEQPAFHTETKDTPRPWNAPRASPAAATEKQFFASSTSTDSDAPLNGREREGAQRASPETQQVSKGRKRTPAETRSAVVERRCFQRTRIVPFGYLQMDGSNGGIVLNISESGVAITTATILTDDHLPAVNVQFPDASGWIEASGQIAWKSESKKEAGVRFIGLTEEARQRISDWISAQATTEDLQEQEQRPRIPEEQEEKLKLTEILERGIFVPVPPAPAEKGKKFEEAPLISSTSPRAWGHILYT